MGGPAAAEIAKIALQALLGSSSKLLETLYTTPPHPLTRVLFANNAVSPGFPVLKSMAS
jgi:hypothetical protein